MSDAELTAAAEEAAEETVETKEEETIETPTEEPVEEPAGEPEQPEYDEDGLPLNHAARSDLGRKVAAQFRKMDMLEQQFQDVNSKIDSVLQAFKKPDEEIDPDMPMTFRDFQAIQHRTAQQQAQMAEAYQKAYVSTITNLAKDADEDYYQAVMNEMKNIEYTPSANPARDAELNYLRAERNLLKKTMASKKNPLKGGSPGGTITKQPVKKNNKPLPKLDAAAEDYLAYIRYKDGEEAAQKARKEIS